MTDKKRLEALRDYARCPECGQVLMADEDNVFRCITDESHGPYKLFYEVIDE